MSVYLPLGPQELGESQTQIIFLVGWALREQGQQRVGHFSFVASSAEKNVISA